MAVAVWKGVAGNGLHVLRSVNDLYPLTSGEGARQM